MPSVRGERHVQTSVEHERDLVIATEAGDESACRELVDAFLPSIAAIARHYEAAAGVERQELLQEGVVGLLRAVSRYDVRLETPFWAYASWWVRSAMQQLVAELTGPLVLSDRAIRALAQIKAARRTHERDHGREPTTAELAAATGFAPAQVDRLLTSGRNARGLEEPLGADPGDTTLGELISDPLAEEEYDRVLDGAELEQVQDLTASLSERERAVLAAHYGLGQAQQTFAEIADVLGVSAERARQIEAAALEKLREAAAGPVYAQGGVP